MMKNGGSGKPRSKVENRIPTVDLRRLEPIINQLIDGVGDTENIANQLEAWGLPRVLDQTEQLRLALRLLECHDQSASGGSKRQVEPTL